MKLKIESDGTRFGTFVRHVETGEIVEGITRVEFLPLDARDIEGLRAVVTLQPEYVSLVVDSREAEPPTGARWTPFRVICWIFGHRYRVIDRSRGIAGPLLCPRCGHRMDGVVWPRRPGSPHSGETAP